MINPLTAVKAFFTAKNTLTDITQEASKMNGNTPGWKTSEFYFHLATQIAVLWGAVDGLIPAKYAAIISVAGTAVYTVCRTAYKAYTDIRATTVVSDAQTVVVNK